MTVFKKAGLKAIPLLMAAVTAFSSISIPVHAENTGQDSMRQEIIEITSEHGETAGSTVETQAVTMDENRRIISLSQIMDGLKVTVSARPGVLPDGTQLHVSRIEGVEAIALTQTVMEKAKEDGAVDASGVVALDISLVDADGNKFDPPEEVTVTFEEITKDAYERSMSESFEVYHAVDGNTDQLING